MRGILPSLLVLALVESACARGIDGSLTATRLTSARVMASDWNEAIDPKTGRTYYWNKQTRESTWTRPSEPEEEESAPPAPPGQPPPASNTADSSSTSDAGRSDEIATDDGEATFEEVPVTKPATASRAGGFRSPWVRTRRQLTATYTSAADALRLPKRLRNEEQGGGQAVKKGLFLSSVLVVAAAFL